MDTCDGCLRKRSYKIMPPDTQTGLPDMIKKTINEAQKEHGPSVKAVNWKPEYRVRVLQLRVYKDRNLRVCALCIGTAIEEANEFLNKKNETVFVVFMKKCLKAETARQKEKQNNKKSDEDNNEDSDESAPN